jgi:RNA polymerase sigma-70 factor (ECF subfamily)
MDHDAASRWRAIEELHPASFAWARACAGGESEAEDVLQTVYEKIADGRATFGGRASLKTWLFGVIRWTAEEHQRRARARPSPPRVSEAPPSPEESASRSEAARALLGLLARLPERQRQVLHLVFYEDMTVEAAADAMGVTVGTARVHYDRAKKRMAELLIEKEAAHAGR